MMALVGVSISGMPGPPLGPSPLITTTFPLMQNEDMWLATDRTKAEYDSSKIKQRKSTAGNREY